MRSISYPALSLLLFISLNVIFASDYTLTTVPNPMKAYGEFISNPDNVLSQAQEDSINAVITNIEKSTTAEIAVVVINSIGESDPNEFANKFFEFWGIGKKNKDNGLLLLVVTGTHSWKIETGYGLEGTLPDIVCHRIGLETLVPNFRAGNYGGGILSGVELIGRYIEGNSMVNSINNTDDIAEGKHSKDILLVVLLLTLYMFLTSVGSYFFYRYFKKIINKAESPEDAYNSLGPYTKGSHTGALIAAFLIPGAILCLWLFLTHKKLRTMPRLSKKNGKPMHMLSEAEEDTFLSSGQILEEKLKSKNYDVWITDNKDDVLVIDYKNAATSFGRCSSCQFITEKLVDVVTVKKATTPRAGQDKCTYRCLQCNNERTVLEKVPRITSSTSSPRTSSIGNSDSSSSSGSFGGGRSGGGGASGKW